MARKAFGRRGDRRDRHAAVQEPVRGRGVAPRSDGVGEVDRRGRAAPAGDARGAEREGTVSTPALGLTMLGLIVVAIMMGFPTAFTLMGLGMIFGFIAF